MINLKKLYKENKKTFWKFAGASAFITSFSVGLLILMTSVFKIHYLISYFVSGSIGFFSKYVLNKCWVFRKR